MIVLEKLVRTGRYCGKKRLTKHFRRMSGCEQDISKKKNCFLCCTLNPSTQHDSHTDEEINLQQDTLRFLSTLPCHDLTFSQ